MTMRLARAGNVARVIQPAIIMRSFRSLLSRACGAGRGLDSPRHLRPPAATSLLLLLAVFSSCGVARAADTQWLSGRGGADARAVCAWDQASPGEIREWQFSSKGGRRYKVGLAVWASPAVAIVAGRPMAFIGGYDQTLHALDLLDKRQRWFKITNGEIQEAPAIGQVAGRDVAFWGSADRTVYAHDAATGARLWTHELVPPTSTMGDAILSAPLLCGGTLYITCFVFDKALAREQQTGLLFALEMETGRELWRREVSQGPVGSPVGRMIGGRFLLFVAARKGLLQAFDATPAGASRATRGPTPLWTYQMPHEVFGSPTVEPEGDSPLLFLGSKFGNLIALDAQTGKERWKRMAGNWIDNSACVGDVDGTSVVFVGSHDYNVYAFRCADGELLWKRHLGGEVYSAPSFFHAGADPAVAVASLDNHVYALNARDGRVITSYYTGQPIWDTVAKGETLWGSPVALEAGEQTALLHGSFNDTVYVLPLTGECSLRAVVRSSASLWIGLGVVGALFLGIVLPLVLYVRKRGS